MANLLVPKWWECLVAVLVPWEGVKHCSLPGGVTWKRREWLHVLSLDSYLAQLA